MEPEAEACTMQRLSKTNLRCGVLSSDARHHAGTGICLHGAALQSLSQSEQGRQVLRSALQANPFDAALLSALLTDAQARRDLASAADLAGRLSRLRPDDAELARLAARLARP